MDLVGLDHGRLATLLDAGRGLVRELRTDAVLEELLRLACELTGARYAALGVLDSGRRELERFVTHGVDAATHEAIGELPRGRGILGVLIRDPRPLRLDRVGEHPESYGFPAHHPPMETFLGVPVSIRGEPWGNLYLTEKEGGPFDEADEAAVLVLAAWAAIAIDNARLHEDAAQRREDAERAVRRLEATTAIARAVGSETELDRVLELIVKRGRALVDARAVVLLLLDGEELVAAAAAGQVAHGIAGGRLPVDGSAAGEVVRSGRPERISDVPGRLRDAEGLLGVSDAETALLVPLVYRGRPLGLLAAFDRAGDVPTFHAEEERLLEAFAASAATAVATARSVAADRLRLSIGAAEQERRRWARELHDETLQGLAALQVLLGSGLRRGTPEAVEAAARDAVDLITTEISNLRTLITELRPAALDELGLAPAIESLVARQGAVHDVEVDASVDVPARLDPEIETAAYRLVQESLTNIVKHASAERVRVRVAVEHEALAIEVEDDGRGFEVSAPAAGFGLMGMRERIELAGGRLELQSEPGRTLVRARLPLRGSSTP
jgi:signal transduction histidine kinase